MRAVLDPNILIAALLSPAGAPAQLVGRWLSGEFELVVSETLLGELERALAYPKLRRRITVEEAAELAAVLRDGALVAPDPPNPAPRSADPGDDYLLALAESRHAVLVSGDRHLLALAEQLPIKTARAFLDSVIDGFIRVYQISTLTQAPPSSAYHEVTWPPLIRRSQSTSRTPGIRTAPTGRG